MYLIAVSNEKGGVAKTTTSASLGAALAQQGMRVLLVDLDAQANLTLSVGIDPSSTPLCSANMLLSAEPVLNIIRKTEVENLDIIPSNKSMGTAERFLPVHQDYEYFLRNALISVKNDYDFVVIDCPPYLGSVTTNAFVAADLLLVPTQAEYFSIYALRNLMDSVRNIRQKYNPKLTYRLILTMFDKRNKTHRLMHEQLRAKFNSGMLETVISIDTKVRESTIAGLPIIQHAPKSRAAVQYQAVAQEIIDYVKETTTLQPA